MRPSDKNHAEHAKRGIIGIRRLRNLLGDHHDAQLARPLHDHATRPRLRRLLRVHGRDRLRRFRNRAVILLDELQRLRRIEVADDRHGRIVRPVKRVVKRTQLFDRHFFEIAAPADRAVMIRMREKRGRPHFLLKRLGRIVLAAFVFVSHDRHFRPAVILAQPQISHAIGFEHDGHRQILRANGFEVIRAIERRRRVRHRSGALEQLIVAIAGLLVVLARALEHQMLEQMSRSGRAVRLISRANAIRDHHRHRRRRMIRQQEHGQAIRVEPVLRNPLHRPHVRETGRYRGSCGRACRRDREQSCNENVALDQRAFIHMRIRKLRGNRTGNRWAGPHDKEFSDGRTS